MPPPNGSNAWRPISRAAEKLAAAFRYEEAIALLARIAKNEHPRLADRAARAKELIGRLTADRKRQRTLAEEACQCARQRLAAFDYEGAAQCLDDVPEPLHNDDLQQLRKQIEDRRREIEALTEELRDAVGRKRLLELPVRIKRLLALKPDHAAAKELAAQLQRRFVAAAKKMLAENRYEKAHQLLEQLSFASDAPDFQQLRRQAAELAWLAGDLQNSPVVDDTLTAVAERLRGSAPDDARTVRLCDELQRRSRIAAGKQNQQTQEWAKPPQKTPFGVPVEWLAGFRRTDFAEAFDRTELLRHPGRFAVACGLALAGLKRATLRIDLLAAQQPGVLRRVKNLMQQPLGSRPAWGIDVGVSGLKAVKLSWNESKRQAVVEDAAFVEHAKPLSHAANDADETKVVAETLKKFLESHEIKTERVCAGLPGRMTLVRQIKMPPVGAAKAAKLARFEAAHQFPIPFDQLAWDYQLLDDASPNGDAKPKAAEEKSRHALLIAAKRTTTEHFLTPFQRHDVRVDVLQADFLALHNFLAYDCFAAADPPSDGPPPATAALDVGCDVTNIVVSSPDSLWFRRCGVAGQSFTRALVQEFNLSIAQAEQRKRAPATAERMSDLYAALSPVFDDLLTEVQESLASYSAAHPDRPVQRILAVGGGFALHGLFRHLRCGR